MIRGKTFHTIIFDEYVYLLESKNKCPGCGCSILETERACPDCDEYLFEEE